MPAELPQSAARRRHRRRPGHAAHGDVIRSASAAALPETAADKAVAAGKRGAFFCATRRSTASTLRVLTTRGPDGSALQIALPLAEVDDALARLRWILLAVTLGGVGVASALGVGVSRRARRARSGG